MEDLIRDFLRRGRRFAVFGVSRDPGKYGYRVYFDLKAKGFEVYAVNPNIDSVDGDRVYASVFDLPVKVDVAVLVVPPAVGLKVVEDCVRAGVGRFWLQPGAESEEILEFCEKSGVKVVWGVCVMVESAGGFYG
ncbi:MAG: CoA-binding protein [Candidatus Odinarchaeum yellowstonii]|uniref:CoA-binding protein n=1 Tax=Odinarchaeota yellowstonii (strain LCB_4) TaxID=1841599 RepID=A0AAF0IBT3_ODILC|nr:MAG: CoA-binding protein [Candidatus Odinarchaeum yellowstonii]